MEGKTLKAENILSTIGAYKSKLHFFFCVYLAQELGILPPVYSFDFSMKIPTCNKLENETAALFGSEKILPQNGKGSYRLNHAKIKKEEVSLAPGQRSALCELSDLQTEDLIKIALVLPSLPNRISGGNPKENKKMIAEELLVEPGEAERIYRILYKLESLLFAAPESKQRYKNRNIP